MFVEILLIFLWIFLSPPIVPCAYQKSKVNIFGFLHTTAQISKAYNARILCFQNYGSLACA